MNYTAFSHGQIQSKLWLCQEIEKYITCPVSVVILGSWYNVLGFLLLSRNSNLYRFIEGIDYDQDNINISNKLCDGWMINDDKKIRNICSDVNTVNLSNYDLIICTSTEDIEHTNWFTQIPKNRLVCLQTNNLVYEKVKHYQNWEIKNSNSDMETFKKKYELSNILFEGTKYFDYSNLKYSRYMLIGKK